MKYDILALHHVVDEVAIFDGSADDPTLLAHIRIAESEIPDQRAGIISNHCGGRCSGDDKRFGKMAAYEPAGTGNENLFSSQHESAAPYGFRDQTVRPLKRRVV